MRRRNALRHPLLVVFELARWETWNPEMLPVPDHLTRSMSNLTEMRRRLGIPTELGDAATAWVRQLTRSAQAPDGRMPTTRVPGFGPLPSAAVVSTIPAKSQPGRQP